MSGALDPIRAHPKELAAALQALSAPTPVAGEPEPEAWTQVVAARLDDGVWTLYLRRGVRNASFASRLIFGARIVTEDPLFCGKVEAPTEPSDADCEGMRRARLERLADAERRAWESRGAPELDSDPGDESGGES